MRGTVRGLGRSRLPPPPPRVFSLPMRCIAVGTNAQVSGYGHQCLGKCPLRCSACIIMRMMMVSRQCWYTCLAQPELPPGAPKSPGPRRTQTAAEQPSPPPAFPSKVPSDLKNVPLDNRVGLIRAWPILNLYLIEARACCYVISKFEVK